MTDKYKRTFNDFENQEWPGKIIPEHFEHGTYSDNYRGIQGMLQHAMAAYGPYHVIEGCEPKIDGTAVSGTAGYVMNSGSIIEVSVGSEVVLTGTALWYCVDSTGGYFTTGAKPTGTIIAANIGGNVYDIRSNRWNENSKRYFANSVTFYKDINVYQNATISGTRYLSGDSIETGVYRAQGVHYRDGNTQLTGARYFSGIEEVTGNKDILGDYDINGNITGHANYISGYAQGQFTQLTGTYMSGGFANLSQLTGIYMSGTYMSGSEATFTRGVFEELNDKIYYVSTDAELDAAISDIEANNYYGTIFVTEDIDNVQATLNNGSAGYTIDLCGHTLGANGNNRIFTISNYDHFTIRNGKLDCSDFTSDDTEAIYVGTVDKFGTITNIRITGDDSHGLGIENNSDNFNINNCYTSDTYGGIYSKGDNCTITGNTCNNNNNRGIYNEGDNCTITGNTCNNNGIGIENDGSNCTITGNTCNDNSIGIDNDGSNCTITGNTCNNNTHGISNGNGDNCTITGNTCNDNSVGIYDGGDNCTITGNTCNDNTYGIENDGPNCTITGNTCNNNDIGIYNKANYCVIVGNTLRSDDGVDNDGSNCIVEHNVTTPL